MRRQQRVFNFARRASAFAEETASESFRVSEGVVEVDSTRTVAGRKDKTVTKHLGRVLGFANREDGTQGR
eukprot:1339011-Pyramimonas_sp.AAC.1